MKSTMISEFVTHACAAAVSGNGYDLGDVCEISDKILHIMHPDMNHLKENDDGGGSYPEKSQVLFDKYLDEVEFALTEIGLCYDITKSTWIVKPRKETVAVQIPFPLGDRDVFVYDVPENGVTIEQALENFKGQADEDYSINDLEAYFEKQGFVVAQVTRLEGEY